MKNMKLNALENQSLNNREMNAVRGGDCTRVCSCSCYYANNNGSSINANGDANYGSGASGTDSKKGNAVYFADNCLGSKTEYAAG
jgi:natural product precursor